MKKRIFSLFLVLILAFVSVEDVRADAGSLIIAGGSVATIGAGAIAGPAVVAVFCAMMAFGMNVELTQASEEAGMTKTEFLKNKIQQYCNEARISANTFNNYILDQANVFQNGAISLTDRAGNLIEKFCNWLFSSENVNVPSGSINSSVVLNGITCPVIMPGDSGFLGKMQNTNDIIYYYYTGSKPLAIIRLQVHEGQYVSNLICGITKDSTASENLHIGCKYTANGNNQYEENFTRFTLQSNGVYGVPIGFFYEHDLSQSVVNVTGYIGSNYNDAFENFVNGITDIDFGGVVNTDSVTGDMTNYEENKNLLNPTEGQTIVVNPNITIPVPQDIDVSIDVNEYLEKVQELIDGATDNIITAIDDATGVPITIEWDPTQDWDPTIEKEHDTDLPPDDERTPIIEDNIIPYDFDPDPMKFDLKGIFPFCIPWDVKDMLSKLSAEPVAPSYTVNWMIPIVNERLIFTVDLSPFNGVAQVCRTMELLAFCIGLAVVTRQLFLRG